jgi:hypothetical protein
MRAPTAPTINVEHKGGGGLMLVLNASGADMKNNTAGTITMARMAEPVRLVM